MIPRRQNGLGARNRSRCTTCDQPRIIQGDPHEPPLGQMLAKARARARARGTASVGQSLGFGGVVNNQSGMTWAKQGPRAMARARARAKARTSETRERAKARVTNVFHSVWVHTGSIHAPSSVGLGTGESLR